MSKKVYNIIFVGLVVAILVCVGSYLLKQRNSPEYWTGYAMSTTITQTAYGSNAFDTMRLLQSQLVEFENEMSMFKPESEIYKLNQNAGNGEMSLSNDVFDMLEISKQLAEKAEGVFTITIAPVTTLWGITGANPQVPETKELAQAMALVGEDGLVLNKETKTAKLMQRGQAVDLGAIAKGRACDIAKKIYSENGVESAVLSIGGNIYVHGKKPNGEMFKVGFRDPTQTENSYIASIRFENAVMAVSGGYERNFVGSDGKTYHHIINPNTGYPAVSDIVSVGVISPDGAVADFYSTTLFVWGKEKTIEYIKKGENQIIMLDDQKNLYVSKSLEPVFELHGEQDITVNFI